MNNKKKPKLYVFAGLNGIDKSTIIKFSKLADKTHIINPDEIAKKISNYNQQLADTPSIQIKAVRLALK